MIYIYDKNKKEATMELNKEIILQKLSEIDKDEFGFNKIGLFGSFSRDEQTPESDIDIFVELKLQKGLYKNYCKLYNYLEELFGRKVDLLTSGHMEYKYHNPKVIAYKEKIRKEILESVIYI